MHDDIQIRPLHACDAAFLSEALYHAIFVPPDAVAPPKSIIHNPDLARYIEGFGTQPGDEGTLALHGATPVGAAWSRFMRGYGFVDDATPELSISVMPGYRGRGIGTRMLIALFAQLNGQAEQISLSVNRANPAYRLYKRLGFEVITADDDHVVMLREV
jgi:ribosomal protein S18 acetylase RimI-like enzyme